MCIYIYTLIQKVPKEKILILYANINQYIGQTLIDFQVCHVDFQSNLTEVHLLKMAIFKIIVHNICLKMTSKFELKYF